MALNSFTFLLLFLPAVIAGVMLLRDRVGPRAAQWVVLAASLLFYFWRKGWIDSRFFSVRRPRRGGHPPAA